MTELPHLETADQRVLGSLLEKQATVPASYPLTANALRTACNQTNSRDPVVDFDHETVEQTARSLKERGLLRIVWSDTGRRTLKYHQTLDEGLALEADERALITVLLLRGAQAPGELRTRTERLFAFTDRRDVEACLHRMAERPQPLVRELELRPGQQDRRWIHLLGPVPQQDPPTGTAAVDREAVIAEGADRRDAQVLSAYDAVAVAYADDAIGRLRDQPFETWLLDRVLTYAGAGHVVEVGSGPGHVTAYLAGHGADARGIDLSPAMVSEARRRFPGLRYDVGDQRHLTRPEDDAEWAVVLSWFSLVHLAESELADSIGALVRPLSPGGWLVLGLDAGAEVRHLDEWYGRRVDLTFVPHEPETVVSVVEAAGLVDVEWYLRGPVASRDEASQRLFVVGHTAR